MGLGVSHQGTTQAGLGRKYVSGLGTLGEQHRRPR